MSVSLSQVSSSQESSVNSRPLSTKDALKEASISMGHSRLLSAVPLEIQELLQAIAERNNALKCQAEAADTKK
jgi:hypothetical protein